MLLSISIRKCHRWTNLCKTQKRINVLVQIRTYWWEKLPKINKRTGTFIRNSRVSCQTTRSQGDQGFYKQVNRLWMNTLTVFK